MSAVTDLIKVAKDAIEEVNEAMADGKLTKEEYNEVFLAFDLLGHVIHRNVMIAWGMVDDVAGGDDAA